MSDLELISRKDVYDYYKAYYAPDNAFIVVIGDVDAERIFEKINGIFGSIPRGKERAKIGTVEPVQQGERRIALIKEAQLPYLLIAYHVPNFPHEDSYALDVLESILSGKSGRLYKNIVYDEKIALNAFSDYMEIYLDPMLFVIGGTAPADGDIEKVEKALYREIEKVKKTPPSAREVQKAKNQVEASFIMGQDSLYMQARVVGMFEILGSWRLKDTYVEGIRKVTPEDVQRVANKYFATENRTVGVLIPKTD
jgi:zinc protease